MTADGLRLLETRPPGEPLAQLMLAHGAGAPMDSDFMNLLSQALARQGLAVVRFEFPYMAERRASGTRRPPDRMPVLLDSYRAHLAERPDVCAPLFIGGKSMGGRVASLLADEVQPAGLVCFGYPFHPPGKPERTRTAHLEQLATPALILQGTRDPFGRPEEVDSYALSARIRVHWLESGDHDFKPLRSSGLTQQQLIDQAALRVTDFIRDQLDCISA